MRWREHSSSFIYNQINLITDSDVGPLLKHLSVRKPESNWMQQTNAVVTKYAWPPGKISTSVVKIL